jgi:AcrR family transcriptional regulator
MNVRSDRRQAAIDRMADYILLEGLGAATLRPLANAAGTSDRMLLYYFADKDELLAATLGGIAARMTAQLDNAIPIGRLRSFPVLLEEVWAALSSEHLKPFMHVWLDLAAGAAGGLQPHLDIAGEIADGFLAWVASRLEGKSDTAPPLSAELFLAAIEGMYLLRAIGRLAIADKAMTEFTTSARRWRRR